MSKAVRSHLSFLNFLRTATNAQRKAVLQVASREEIDALSEIILNILKGIVNVSLQEKAALRKRRAVLQQIASPYASVKSRRESLIKITTVLPLALRSVILTKQK